MSKFQLILTSIFAICIVFGIGIFALSKSSSSAQSARLVVWGTISQDAFTAAYKAASIAKVKSTTVTYVQKDPASFESDFIEALADGIGPDVVVIRDDQLYKNRNRLFVIPYASYPERTFKDTFIEEGESFLSPEGTVALPLIVDPMVMYWNRDLFSNSLVSQPPKYWDEFYALIGKMTHKDSSADITQSALALGEWNNITNAKEILSQIIMQAGTPITARTSSGVSSVLNSQFNYPTVPSQSAVNFYTQFSNPSSQNYTWNRSLPSSFNFFLSGNLATYFGFASEIFSIQQKNANLNFDVTYMPQIRDTQKKDVFAHMYAAAIVKQSKQIGPAFSLITSLVEPAALKALETVTNLPPVRRDMLASLPTDAFRVVFYNSALLSHTWIDPDALATAGIFRDMIEGITSGQSRTSDALSTADQALTPLFK